MFPLSTCHRVETSRTCGWTHGIHLSSLNMRDGCMSKTLLSSLSRTDFQGLLACLVQQFMMVQGYPALPAATWTCQVVAGLDEDDPNNPATIADNAPRTRAATKSHCGQSLGLWVGLGLFRNGWEGSCMPPYFGVTRSTGGRCFRRLRWATTWGTSRAWAPTFSAPSPRAPARPW